MNPGRKSRQISLTRFGIRLCVLTFSVVFLHFSTQAQYDLQGLSEQILRGTDEVKRSALMQIRNLESEEASRIAVPALSDISEIIRATAAHSVIFLNDDEATSVLLPLLDDREKFVRREAAYALGKVGSETAAPKLVYHLEKDKESEVRTACAVALGNTKSVVSVAALEKLLSKKPKSKNAFLRRAAARSIGQIAQYLQQQFPTDTTPESFLPEKYKPVAKPKYRQLGVAYPVFSSANATLIGVLKNTSEKDDVLREAAFALGEISDQSSDAILVPFLKSKDYYLVEICKEAIRKIRSVQVRNEDT